MSLISLLLVGATLVTQVITRSEQATAATNETINFQARLLTASGSVVQDGYYNVEFKLYDTSSGGTSLWTETRTAADKVRVVNGYMTVNLGSVTSFPNTIDWDQELWMTMNIGGLTETPDWDGEMSPRLKLTSVPFSKRAGELAGGSGANRTVLDTGTPSGDNLLHLPAESGTLCVQNSSACGFMTTASGVQLQPSTPGTVQTGNFNISGTGIAGTALLTPLLDTSGGLSLGTVSATSISMGNTSIDIAITGSTISLDGEVLVQGLSAGSSTALTVNSGAASNIGLVVVGHASQSADMFRLQDASANTVFKVDADGDATIARTLDIQYQSGVTNQLAIQGPSSTFVTVNAAQNRFYIGGDAVQCTGRFCVFQNTTGTGGSSYINSYNVSQLNVSTSSVAINQEILLTDTSTGIANTLRGIRINSSNTTNTSADIYSLQIQLPSTTSGSTYGGNAIQIQNGSTNIFRVTNVGQTLIQTTNGTNTAFMVQNASSNAVLTVDTGGNQVLLGKASVLSGRLRFHNATNANTATLVSGTTSASYTLTLPTALADTGTCLKDGGTGSLLFEACATLQQAYDAGNQITATDNRSLLVTLADTATDSNFVVDLQCDTSCAANGRFIVQDDGTQVFGIHPGSEGGAAYFQNATNTTNAFNIQNATGTDMFRVDTSNNYVVVGAGSGTSTPVQLVLADRNTSGDPGTSTNGAMYYNSNSGRFRCYENGTWKNCLGFDANLIIYGANGNGAASQWTNMPSALTEIFGSDVPSPASRVLYDLSNATQIRFQVNVAQIGSTNAEIRIQYSTDQSTWSYLDNGNTGLGQNINTTGLKTSSWSTIASGARGDVYLRAVGINGNGSANPRFGLIQIQAR